MTELRYFSFLYAGISNSLTILIPLQLQTSLRNQFSALKKFVFERIQYKLFFKNKLSKYSF